MTRTFRILVVDDDEDNACSLGELFELEGHSVTVVHSGDDAIAAYLESEFDMAFMDVMMPGRNGVESFMEIRKLKPDARVFMMTGYSVEQLLQQAVDNGAMGVLTKPVDIDKLLRAVNEAAPAGIVLIADDDPGCGRQIKSLMDDAGYECDLLRDEDRLNEGQSHGLIAGYVHHQQADRYDVLWSDQNDFGDHEIQAEEVRRAHAVASRYYRMLVMDSGNTARAANWPTC